MIKREKLAYLLFLITICQIYVLGFIDNLAHIFEYYSISNTLKQYFFISKIVMVVGICFSIYWRVYTFNMDLALKIGTSQLQNSEDDTKTENMDLYSKFAPDDLDSIN
jgi:lipid A disaccharide synthetase